MEEDVGVWSFVESGPVPPFLKGSKLLLSTSLPGTPQDLYDVLLANESHFLEDM